MSNHDRISRWLDQGAIPGDQVDQAIQAAGLVPTADQWALFLHRLLLWLGVLALGVSAIFLVAFNWEALGRLGQFALLETALVAAVLVQLVFAHRRLLAAGALVLASLLLGALLALVGQTYQTGADPWQLFGLWALLILPWVWLAGLPALWLFWVGLLDVTVVLYLGASPHRLELLLPSSADALWGLVAFNTAVWVIWEAITPADRSRWAVRVIALGSGVPMTLLALFAILGESGMGSAFWVWLVWLGGVMGTYRYWRLDLFMLAGGCLSAITVGAVFYVSAMIREPGGGFLILAMLIIGASLGTAAWLRTLNRESES